MSPGIILMKSGLALIVILMVAVVAFAAATLSAQDADLSAHYFTYQRADGNRMVAGRGSFPDVAAFDVALDAIPVWVVGVPDGDVARWVVTLADGSLQEVVIVAGEARATPLDSPDIVAGQPPLVALNQIGEISIITGGVDASPLSHPAPVDSGLLYVARNGDVVRVDEDGAETGRLALNALPDARIVVNSEGLAALYGGATNQRYVHGIMGDDLEGAALVVLSPADMSISTHVELGGDAVFEGIAPFWADVDEDGTEDLVTTVSDSRGGAQIRVYHADGSILANGSPIGRAFRWRHQLAWGAFGPQGENELTDVLTPHIGGLPEFFRLSGGDELAVAAATSGYTSHLINTRNLDMGFGGDLNGDGRPELVLADQRMERIAGLQHTADNTVTEMWTLPLGARLTTNLAAVTLPVNEMIALAAGTLDGRLRVWISR